MERDVALHIRLRVRSLDGSIIGCDFKKVGVVRLRKATGTMICAQCTEPFITI